MFAQNQWLVLTNGQTIEGNISLDDDRYTVEMQNGSRIIIGADRVNFVADSISDIYWDKWSRVDPTDANSHISLFRWCLKHDLLDEAQQQIDLVAKIENLEDQASHLTRMAQELELVFTRIEKEALLAKQKEIEALQIRSLPEIETGRKPEFAAVPTIPSTPIDEEGRPVRRLEPMPQRGPDVASEVELVDFEEDVAPAPKPLTRRSKPAWVNNRQLDRETRMMADGTVSFYKRHLEPTLIENCIQCHDSRSVAMPLSKRSFGQTIPRRMSQQNLHFVMEQVDRSNPLASKLLSMATMAHGEQSSAAFSANDPFVFELKKWSVAVSTDPARWLMQLAEESYVSPIPAASQDRPEVQSELPEQPKPQQQSVETAEQTANEVIEVESPAVDPYDPSEFNRK
ncbi:hypothetical protein [Mariniblastus fucicola]|uniref:hypothetical protein n=1 Tax=Mariniblastus fucicola TaxID=980251 RepID=UPI00143CDA23|nr:hypothetical protein [Mariniblastus fucicola]